MKLHSGINAFEQYIWCEPTIYLDQRIRRIGVIIPKDSDMTPEKLKKTAEDLAKECSCRVVIQYRREKESKH